MAHAYSRSLQPMGDNEEEAAAAAEETSDASTVHSEDLDDMQARLTDLDTATRELHDTRKKMKSMNEKLKRLQATKISSAKKIDELIDPPRAPAADVTATRQRLHVRPTCVSTTHALRIMKEQQAKKDEEDAEAEKRRVQAAEKKESKKQAEDEQQQVKTTLLSLGYMTADDKILPVGALKSFLQRNGPAAAAGNVTVPSYPTKKGNAIAAMKAILNYAVQHAQVILQPAEASAATASASVLAAAEADA